MKSLNSLLIANINNNINVKKSGPTELKLFSHNIRSLAKNIYKLIDDNDLYDKYDILTFNETNLRFEKVANGSLLSNRAARVRNRAILV